MKRAKAKKQKRYSRNQKVFTFTIPENSSLFEKYQIQQRNLDNDEIAQQQACDESEAQSPESESSFEASINYRLKEDNNSKIIKSVSGESSLKYDNNKLGAEEEPVNAYYSRDQQQADESDINDQAVDQEAQSYNGFEIDWDLSEKIEPQLKFTERELSFLIEETVAFFQLPMFMKNLNCTALLILKALFCYEKRKWDAYLKTYGCGNFLRYIKSRTGLRRVEISETMTNLISLVYDDQKQYFGGNETDCFLSEACLPDFIDYIILKKLKLDFDSPHSACLAVFFRHPLGRIFFPGFVVIYEKLIQFLDQTIQYSATEEKMQRAQQARLEHMAQLIYIIEDYYMHQTKENSAARQEQ